MLVDLDAIKQRGKQMKKDKETEENKEECGEPEGLKIPKGLITHTANQYSRGFKSGFAEGFEAGFTFALNVCSQCENLQQKEIKKGLEENKDVV